MPGKSDSTDQSAAILVFVIVGAVFIALGSAGLHRAILTESPLSTLFATFFMGIGLMCAALVSSAD